MNKLSCVAFTLLLSLPALAANWPGWRGDGSGVSPEKHLPVAWSATQNVAWSSLLPGEGNSSPVVWGDRIYLTTALDKGKTRAVLCLDVKDGRLVWQKNLPAERAPVTDSKNGYASPTPVTDGVNLYAFFDSPGLTALDLAGNVLWTHDLGPFVNSYNQAASPVLYHDLVIETCDQNTGSFVVALEKATGKERWCTPRRTSSHFASPIVITANGKDQLIVSADTIIAYDPATGTELWRCAGMTPCVTPSPIFANGLVYATSGRNGPTVAIDPGGTGNVTETHVRLRATSGGPYVPSPLYYPLLALPGDNGALKFLDDNGAVAAEVRATGHFTASPVAGDGKIYWPDEQGKVFVIETTGLTGTTPAAKILAVNALGERCLASPAIADGRLYLRTEHHLFAILPGGVAALLAASAVVAGYDELEQRFKAHPAADGPDVLIRLEVVEAMAQLKDPKAIPLLLQAAMKDPHWDVGEAAAKALGQLGAPAIPVLLELLQKAEPWRAFLKVIAADALGRLEPTDATVPLVKTTQPGNDAQTRAAAVQALGKIAVAHDSELPTVLPALLAALRDADSGVRLVAVRALAQLPGKVGTQRDAVVQGLLDAVADHATAVTQAAAQALTAYQVPREVMMRDVLRYGEHRKAPIVYDLHAGPIRLKFQDGELRYLYAGDREIVRRVYFAVRDSRWDTLTPTLTTLDVQQQADAFVIKLAATLKNDIVDYSWAGTITGTATGKITFTVQGQPNADFTTPRLGMCVLFGAASLAGQPYELVDEKGDVRPGVFPVNVSRSLLADLFTFRTLRYVTANGMMVSVGLTPDGFGMEDQRNFGDSSYKAMSNVSSPFPNLKKGRQTSQTLTLEVKNAPAAPPAPAVAMTTVTIGAPIPGARLPKLVSPAVPATTNTFRTYNDDPKKYANAAAMVMSYCPAMHLPDDDTYLENQPTVQDWGCTLRAFDPKAKLRLDPITMNAPYPRPDKDARNRGLFGAAWRVRLLKYLALGGIDEAAFADSDAGYAPLVLQRLAPFAGAQVLATDIHATAPAAIDALAITANGNRIIWLINLTDQPQQVTLPCPGAATLIRLNEHTRLGAALPITNITGRNGQTQLRLEPFEVCEVK